jgi:rhomboid protease GluP
MLRIKLGHVEGWKTVMRSASYPRCADRAFVLLALDIACDWRMGADGTIALRVPSGQHARALHELVLYETEQAMSSTATQAPAQTPRAVRRVARVGSFAYVATLLLFAYLQTHYSAGVDWVDAGRLQAGLVRDGEWWRTVTALTLHADTPHLLGNLIFGALFGYFASVMLASSAAAWLSILLAGATGNLLNALLQPWQHTSIGASTAVFAALGLIAGYQWRIQLQPEEKWLRRLGPLGAGIALLAMLGTGGERTDVSAHLTGFLCGLGAGFGWSLQRDRRPGSGWQILMSAGAGALLFTAWRTALLQAA